MIKRFLITGGAGFIGSALVRHLVGRTPHHILNLDKLTYAGNLSSLASVSKSSRYRFVEGDVCDRDLVSKIFAEFRPHFVMHLAAESHVDRSIAGPFEFVHTNIVGTSVMLECARDYWEHLPSLDDAMDWKVTSSLSVTKEKGGSREASHLVSKQNFRFHHISTDEVYGSLGETGLFSEESIYDPSSPYSASKASSDHLVRAWHRTYGLPTLITNCSNNYGPHQFPEKLVPLMILNALEEKPLPVYGNGQQIRDWLYVEDHARALYKVVTEGEVGHTYNIGGHNEKMNIEVVHTVCEILDELVPRNGSHKDLIAFVADRPGHDQRYAIDATKIKKDLGWTPQETFATGLKKTVQWYLDNLDWCESVRDHRSHGHGLGMVQQKTGSVQ